jgi:LuxR family maltose regulon positive regulatory protein
VRELAIAAESRHQLELVDSITARIALIRGDLVTARRWLDVSSPRLVDDDLKSIEQRFLTRVKVLVAVDTPATLGEAAGLLEEFVTLARAQHMMLALLEGLAVQALLHEARGEGAAASRVLRESLQKAAPEGIVQRFAYLGPALAPILRRLLAEPVPVPHAGKTLRALEAVLAAQPATRAVAAHPDALETPLTDREVDVLHRLALRLTNNEIGAELFISPITVKNHIAHISDKLGVSGRRAVVARANELGLLLTES